MLKSAIPDSVESFTGCGISGSQGFSFSVRHSNLTVTVSDEVLYFLLMPLLYTTLSAFARVISDYS